MHRRVCEGCGSRKWRRQLKSLNLGLLAKILVAWPLMRLFFQNVQDRQLFWLSCFTNRACFNCGRVEQSFLEGTLPVVFPERLPGGGRNASSARCPNCGFQYRFDGQSCGHCHFNLAAAAPAPQTPRRSGDEQPTGGTRNAVASVLSSAISQTDDEWRPILPIPRNRPKHAPAAQHAVGEQAANCDSRDSRSCDSEADDDDEEELFHFEDFSPELQAMAKSGLVPYSMTLSEIDYWEQELSAIETLCWLMDEYKTPADVPADVLNSILPFM